MNFDIALGHLCGNVRSPVLRDSLPASCSFPVYFKSGQSDRVVSPAAQRAVTMSNTSSCAAHPVPQDECQECWSIPGGLWLVIMFFSLRHINHEHLHIPEHVHALPGSRNRKEIQEKDHGTYFVVYAGFVCLGVCKFQVGLHFFS